MTVQVAIVGGGFGGLSAAKVLKNQAGISVTLIDRKNHHLFQPLLYQVATGGLSPGDIAFPLRSLFASSSNIRVRMGNVSGLSLQQKFLETDFGPLSYDYLILACGSELGYFGHSNWASHATGLKTLEEATQIRRQILMAFEKAENSTSPQKARELLTFIVIGGGPTGVELAGAIAELSRHTLRRDFRQIDPAQSRIILMEAGPRILPSFDSKVSRLATLQLEEIGVSVWTSSFVSAIQEGGIQMGGEFIRAGTIIWAAGVEASPLNQKLNVNLDRQSRVVVEPDLSLPGFPEIFVVGDQASFTQDGMTLPGQAPAAIQQGRFAAQCILRDQKNLARKNFVFRDKGQMATIGRRRAIVEIKDWRFGGFGAWLTWLAVHLYYLIGFKNRVFVFMQWVWSYFTFRRGARLILEAELKNFTSENE
jgi:NADH dehydrogenase